MRTWRITSSKGAAVDYLCLASAVRFVSTHRGILGKKYDEVC